MEAGTPVGRLSVPFGIENLNVRIIGIGDHFATRVKETLVIPRINSKSVRIVITVRRKKIDIFSRTLNDVAVPFRSVAHKRAAGNDLNRRINRLHTRNEIINNFDVFFGRSARRHNFVVDFPIFDSVWLCMTVFRSNGAPFCRRVAITVLQPVANLL